MLSDCLREEAVPQPPGTGPGFRLLRVPMMTTVHHQMCLQLAHECQF